MGKRNSSKTRVVPIFDRLFASDPTGLSWLPGQAQCRVAAILYPAGDTRAKEARIAIHDPSSGRIGGEVHLRPVDIDYIARLVGVRDSAGGMLRERAAYARHLAFGAELRSGSSGGDRLRVSL